MVIAETGPIQKKQSVPRIQIIQKNFRFSGQMQVLKPCVEYSKGESSQPSTFTGKLDNLFNIDDLIFWQSVEMRILMLKIMYM